MKAPQTAAMEIVALDSLISERLAVGGRGKRLSVFQDSITTAT
jgi:hypothetical protein